MPKDGKKIAAGLGIAAIVTTAIIFATRPAKAVVPPEPEPGLANLYGKVTNAQTGGAVPGALVTLDGLSVTTDSGGNYAFLDLTPGSYSGSASKSGYEPAYF